MEATRNLSLAEKGKSSKRNGKSAKEELAMADHLSAQSVEERFEEGRTLARPSTEARVGTNEKGKPENEELELSDDEGSASWNFMDDSSLEELMEMKAHTREVYRSLETLSLWEEQM